MDILWKDNNLFYNVLCFLITENEKLFDRSDARLYWRTVIHIFCLIHHCNVGIFALSMDKHLRAHTHPEIQTLHTFGPAYFTGWNFLGFVQGLINHVLKDCFAFYDFYLFQGIFFLLAFSNDILEWMGKHKEEYGNTLRYYRDVLYSGIVVPYTLFTTIMFWGVFAIDRELVFPQIFDEVVPWWFNQCVHTNITLMVVVETFMQPRRNPVDKRLELILDGAVGVAYAVVYYSIYFFSHRWLYPVFGVMSWWQVCIYQLCVWYSCYLFYLLQFHIGRLIHGEKKKIKD